MLFLEKLSLLNALMPGLVTATTSCIPHDSANPIAQDYPALVSGNLNGTTMIVPISLEEARRLIPSQWPILKDAYQSLLPNFPNDQYPMMVTAVHDHDIQFPLLGLKNPDFSRTSFEFPFVDILNDGYTSFRWTATMMILSTNDMAIEGSRNYGIQVFPSKFDPPCDAYKAASGGKTKMSSVSTDCGKPRSLAIEMQPCHGDGETAFPLSFVKNITNQVTTANGSLCDHYQRLFNTSLTQEPHLPVPVRGNVEGNLEPFNGHRAWKDVYGWRLSTAFLEPPLPGKCTDFQGT